MADLKQQEGATEAPKVEDGADKDCVVEWTDAEGNPKHRAGRHYWIWYHDTPAGWFKAQKCSICGPAPKRFAWQ